MIGPKGYTSISELSFKLSSFDGFTQRDFYEILMKSDIYVAGQEGDCHRLDVRVLAQNAGGYCLIDRSKWSVAAILIYDGGLKDETSDASCHNLSAYPGGFTKIDFEYDELLRSSLAESRLDELMAAGEADEMLQSLTSNDLVSLNEFAGQMIYLTNADAEKVISELERLPKPNTSTGLGKGGRPPKAVIASHLIKKHWPDGIRPSWKEMERVLRTEENFEIRTTTLRAAFKIAFE